MLQVSVVTQTAELAAMRVSWSELIAKSESTTIFDTFDWIWAWWDQIGRRILTSRLYVVVVKDETGSLLGIAPFYVSLSPLPPFRQLNFLGRGVSDYHDVIAIAGQEEAVVAAVYGHLEDSREWQIADLTRLREGGNLRCFMPPSESQFQWQDLFQDECPFIQLPDESTTGDRFDALLKKYSKKMRGNVRYYDRALDRVYATERSIANTTEEVAEAMDALFYLHQRRWNKRWQPGVFSNKRIRLFHQQVAQALLEAGLLRLAVLKLDGSIEAVLYCFSFHGVTSYYQSGFEPALSRRSIGSVTTSLSIRQACEEGNQVFDFLRGDEPYKRRWTKGSSKRNYRRIMAHSDFSSYPWLLRLIQMQQKVEQGVKTWMYNKFSGQTV